MKTYPAQFVETQDALIILSARIFLAGAFLKRTDKFCLNVNWADFKVNLSLNGISF